MSTIQMKGTVRNGRVETEEPINLPDGTHLVISVSSEQSNDVEDNSPQAITAWLNWWESLQPLKISAIEQADTQGWAKKQDEYEAAKSDKDIEGLFP